MRVFVLGLCVHTVGVCVWVAVSVEWASIFFFHGQSCNTKRDFVCECLCLNLTQIWFIVGAGRGHKVCEPVCVCVCVCVC